jgi:YVTN family beta-propeller protein
MRLAQRSAVILAATISGLALTGTAAAAPVSSARGMAGAATNCLKVKATIQLGNSPEGLAVDPATNTVYATIPDGNSVSVINGATHTVTATIGVGSSPQGIAVDPATNTVYAANAGSDSVSVISGQTNTVTATIDVASSVTAVAVNPVTDRIYASGHPTTYVINGQTDTVVATFFGSPAGSFFLSVNSRTDTIYLANRDKYVVVVNGRTNTRTARVDVLGEPVATAVNQRTNTIYAGNGSSGNLSVINGKTNKVTAQITPVYGLGLIAVAVNQRSNDVYVTGGADSVYAVNGRTNTISGSIKHDANGIAVNPSTGTIYTADSAPPGEPEPNTVSALRSTCS